MTIEAQQTFRQEEPGDPETDWIEDAFEFGMTEEFAQEAESVLSQRREDKVAREILQKAEKNLAKWTLRGS